MGHRTAVPGKAKDASSLTHIFPRASVWVESHSVVNEMHSIMRGRGVHWSNYSSSMSAINFKVAAVDCTEIEESDRTANM